ncbi:MAG TPA: hypothetical protein VMS79_05610 [Methanomassiliicoccales archaeon]|jgi:hypothetical protein|nr:hypothetical protein [Methanomassiliicoccales archaeon]
MRKSVFALAIMSLLFAGLALSAAASAQPAYVVETDYVHAVAQEGGNNTTPGAGEFWVAIGGIVIFVGVIAFFLISTLRKRKKKGIE